MHYAATLFFDVGGVILTNGWDEAARTRAAAHFHLDDEFPLRHRALQRELETAGISLDGYLERVVFDRPRAFTLEDFRAFIFEQSQVLPGSLDFVRALAEDGRYRLFTLNNESAELNDYRIQRFRLDEIFDGFLSSCYLRAAKPELEIYRAALAISRPAAGQAFFIDDRAENVESAKALGFQAVHFRDVNQLRQDLSRFGVSTAVS
jgi:putative hydrolase of the HAD superfamily